MATAQEKSNEIQNEVISFFKKESQQINVSNWVYIFNIVRYILTPKNIRTLFVFVIISTAIVGTYKIGSSLTNHFSEKSKQALIQEQETQKKLFESLNIYGNDKYLNILANAEKAATDIFTKNIVLIDKSKNSDHRAYNNSYHQENLKQLVSDKRLIMMAVNSAKEQNIQMYELDVQDLQKALRRIQLYETANYGSILPHYSKMINNFNSRSQAQ